MKPLMEDARADQKHENLIDSDARTLIHRIETVEEAYDLPLIEVRDRGKYGAAERVLHERTQSFLGIQGRRRTQEGVLLPAVDRVGDDVAGRLAKNVLLRHPTDLLVHGLRANDFHDMMIQERNAPLDGVRHLHAVAEHRQDIAWQRGLRPEIEGLMHGI